MSPVLKWKGNKRNDFEKLVPGYFLDQLDRIISLVKNEDNDAVIVIEGQERIGKSTLALIICLYLDRLFSILNIVFFKRFFVKVLRTLKKYQALQYDEAGLGLYKRDATTRGTKIINKILMTVGQRNLFLIFLIPSFKELDPYLRTHRVDVLIRVCEKGYAKIYSKAKIKRIKQLKDGTVYYPSCEFAIRFKKLEGEVWEEYLEHKKKQLADYLKEIDRDEKTEDKISDFKLIIEWSKRNPDVPPKYFLTANPNINPAYVYKVRTDNRDLWRPNPK